MFEGKDSEANVSSRGVFRLDITRGKVVDVIDAYDWFRIPTISTRYWIILGQPTEIPEFSEIPNFNVYNVLYYYVSKSCNYVYNVFQTSMFTMNYFRSWFFSEFTQPSQTSHEAKIVRFPTYIWCPIFMILPSSNSNFWAGFDQLIWLSKSCM